MYVSMYACVAMLCLCGCLHVVAGHDEEGVTLRNLSVENAIRVDFQILMEGRLESFECVAHALGLRARRWGWDARVHGSPAPRMQVCRTRFWAREGAGGPGR